MIASLIILTAVINHAQDVSDVDLLSNLPSQALECSLKFDRNFVANNEQVAAAIEALMEENKNEDQASRRDKPRESDSDGETEEGESESAAVGRRERRERKDVTLEAGATRPPRGDKPCDSDSDEETEEETEEESVEEPLLRRELRGRGRRGRRNRNRRDVTLEAGATRPPRDDKSRDSESDEDTEETESAEETAVLGRRERRDREDKPRDREFGENSEETESAEEILGRRRERRDRDDVTPEAGATRPPRGDKPCDSDSDSAETEEAGAEPLLRRLLRRGRDSSETDAEIAEVDGETGAVEEPCKRRGRGRGRENRRKDTTAEPEETEGGARRELRGRFRGLDAVISDGSLEVAGLTGEVVFGSVDVDMESIALTITVEGTSFMCDVEVRRGNKVSCRAASAGEDDFHLRVECELPADEA